MSFVESEMDLESAYGSRSARSSMRSTRGLPSMDNLKALAAATAAEGGDGESMQDVALTLKLQAKLNEAQRDRERMEKRMEELESRKSPSNSDAIRVIKILKHQPHKLPVPKYEHDKSFQFQELEVENDKLRADLKKLRHSVSEDAGEENSQFKEMLGEYVDLSYLSVSRLRLAVGRVVRGSERASRTYVRCVTRYKWDAAAAAASYCR